jgi:hypothetical protein
VQIRYQIPSDVPPVDFPPRVDKTTGQEVALKVIDLENA